MSQKIAAGPEVSLGPAVVNVRFPETQGPLSQDEEWCLVRVGHDDRERRIRFHDYDRIYEIPGLYEALFHEHLKCVSPEVVSGLLVEAMASEGVSPADHDLRVLELGAGNGMVGERLRRLGADEVIGVDVIPEAAEAARRDRPDVYDDYLVDDLTDPSPETRETLAGHEFNALVSVAALGFDDLPPAAFATGFEAIEPGGWVAFNIKDSFIGEADTSGFAPLLEAMIEQKVLRPVRRRRYRHRDSMSGDPLHYVAIVGTKQAPLPPAIREAMG